jgi:hypothetical protein
MKTRIGKIARLPHTLREQLNHRLADGQLGPGLLRWLNGLEEVQECMKENFDGRPVSGQNLTEWRQGGYRDWELREETRVLAQGFVAEAEELAAETGDVPLADRLSSVAALALGQLLRAAMASDTPDRCKSVLQIVRELSRLRRVDHQEARVEFQRERWETERADAQEREELAHMDAIEEDKMEHRRTMCNMADYEVFVYRECCREGRLSKAQQAEWEARFAARPDLYGKHWSESAAATATARPARPAKSRSRGKARRPASKTSAAKAAKPARPVQSKSNQIKPNQTIADEADGTDATDGSHGSHPTHESHGFHEPEITGSGADKLLES